MKVNDRNKLLIFPAPLKLNLFLRLIRRRTDGYHDIQTLFHLLDHGDELIFRPRADQSIKVLMSFIHQSDVCKINQEDNLVTKAAIQLQQYCDEEGIEYTPHGYDIFLQKVVAPGSGLGSGSSDAATALLVLNRLWGCNLNISGLYCVAQRIGMDVFVFVRGINAWAEGRGDQLTPVLLPQRWYLVAVPKVRINTKQMFKAASLIKMSTPITISDYIEGNDSNVFASIVRDQYKEINSTMHWLEQHATASISGSGSACFAAFNHYEEARKAERTKPEDLLCFVAKSCRQSPLMERLAQVFPLSQTVQK